MVSLKRRLCNTHQVVSFGNQDVQTAIKQYHGSDILKHINRHLDDIARDGISGALIVNAVDKLRGHFTLAALGVKVAFLLI